MSSFQEIEKEIMRESFALVRLAEEKINRNLHEWGLDVELVNGTEIKEYLLNVREKRGSAFFYSVMNEAMLYFRLNVEDNCTIPGVIGAIWKDDDGDAYDNYKVDVNYLKFIVNRLLKLSPKEHLQEIK